MRIFDIKDKEVILHADGIAIPFINKLFDEVEDKTLALKYIKYVVFSGDWNSPYKAFAEDIRDEYLKDDLFGDKNFEIPNNVKVCLDEFIKFTETPSTRLLNAAEEGVDFLIREYNTLKTKQHETDKMGKPLVTAEQVGKWLGQLSGAVKSLETLKEQVIKEQVTSGGRIRGGNELNPYETR